LIRFLYNSSAGFIGYSALAARVYEAYGKPVFVAPNACLPPHTDGERAEIEHTIEERALDKGLRIVSIGRLLEQKQFNAVLKGIAELGRPDVEFHVIGDGPGEACLKALAGKLKLNEQVFFHGALYEPDLKWRVLTRCHLGVLPGRGGLAVQELMWHGLPVIAGVADGTESDLIDEGVNGYLLSASEGAEQLTGLMDRFLRMGPSDRVGMARAALDAVDSRSNIAIMADGFLEAVLTTLQLKTRKQIELPYAATTDSEGRP